MACKELARRIAASKECPVCKSVAGEYDDYDWGFSGELHSGILTVSRTEHYECSKCGCHFSEEYKGSISYDITRWMVEKNDGRCDIEKDVSKDTG